MFVVLQTTARSSECSSVLKGLPATCELLSSFYSTPRRENTALNPIFMFKSIPVLPRKGWNTSAAKSTFTVCVCEGCVCVMCLYVEYVFVCVTYIYMCVYVCDVFMCMSL